MKAPRQRGDGLADRRRPLADASFEDRQRHRSLAQDLVELLEIELRAELLLRLVTRAGPRSMPDLIAAGLADHRAVPLDLALRARTRKARGFHHVIGRLFTAPVLAVQSGVDDQPRRT